jgi:phosphatidylinositol alpha-1,6-mannosyltransferase
VSERTLVVTNDFPPRQGGIESFVISLARRLPPEQVVVYTASMPGDGAVDAALPFPVYRDRTGMLLPTPRVARRARQILRAEGATSVLFGAAAPLGLLADGLRDAGARRIVALTHGHETWWARVPGARQALRRIGDGCDTLTYLGDYTRGVISGALSPEAAARMVQLPPGVDPEVFRPGCGGAEVRARLGIDPERPVVVCVARLKPRKGQDTLIAAMPEVLEQVPDALLLIVGGGPDRDRLERLVDARGVRPAVHFTGPVPWEDVPPYVDAGDVFAMPCRTRRLGLEPEALGIVFLEASATGLPVVVGDSGGAPDACRDGETGYVVDGTSPSAVAARVAELMLDKATARAMGERGRRWVHDAWHWDSLAARLRELLAAD